MLHTVFFNIWRKTLSPMVYVMIVATFVIWLMTMLPASRIAAQTQSVKSDQGDATESPLPKHAAWRFGEIKSKTSNGYFRLEFSPDGKYLAARNRENKVEIRNVESRSLVCQTGGHDGWINGVDFSPDSKYFLTYVGNGVEQVKVWEIASGRLTAEIKCDPIQAVFSDLGESIHVLQENELRVFSWPDGELTNQIELPNNDNIPLAVSRNGRFIVASQQSNNKLAHLTKFIDLENDSTVILDGPAELPKHIVISRDDNWVAAIYPRKDRIRLWNMGNPSGQNYELRGHAHTVQSIAFSRDNRFLVSGSWDKTAVVWDLLTREKIGKLSGHSEHVNAVAFAPDTSTVTTGASGQNDSSVIVWSMKELFFPDDVNPVSTDDFEMAWNRLGSSSPRIALTAVNDMFGSVDELFDLLIGKIGQPTALSRHQIENWIVELDGPSYIIRERATQKLIHLRGQADRILTAALDDAPSTEVRHRITRVLRQPIARPKINVAQLRRLHRSIFLLELICQNLEQQESAIELLQAIAQNHPHIDIARDAAATLERVSTGIGDPIKD